MKDQSELSKLRAAVALLRITLGIIILATWYNNLQDGLYTAAGLTGFFDWLFDSQNGNGSTLTFYQAFLDAVIDPIAGQFATFQMIAEFVMGLALLLGLFTRLFGILAMFFFINLLLSYFGGHEWIWVYVLLFSSALTVTLGAAGRQWGLDCWLQQRYQRPVLAIVG
jgi:uncharacterized membrane protein YphA (DoxX/SURF4 family)